MGLRGSTEVGGGSVQGNDLRCGALFPFREVRKYMAFVLITNCLKYGRHIDGLFQFGTRMQVKCHQRHRSTT